MACWGELNYHGVRSGPPGGEFVAITSGYDSACGIRSDGEVECWGGSMPSPTGGFISFEVGPHDGCGITADSVVSCQSRSGGQSLWLELGPLTALSMGSHQRCGIRPDGSLLCWVGNTIQDTPPGGRFTRVSAGTERTCAVRTDGAAICWGRTAEDHVGRVHPPITDPPHPPYFSRLTEWTELGTVPLPSNGPTQTAPMFTQLGSEPEAASCGRLCTGEFWEMGEFTFETVRAELDLVADLSVVGDEGLSALHWAIERGAQKEIIELLLDNGADPNLVNASGNTPLHYAVRDNADRMVIDVLLDGGADIEARNASDTPVLTLAVEAGTDLKTIRALLARGANPNPGKNTSGDTPLSVAVDISAYDGNPDLVRLLLESGADANERYWDNEVTLLHLYYYRLFERSSSSGDAASPEIVRLLLDHGCDASVTPDDDWFGGSLLLWAMVSGTPDPEVISLLLEHGASLAATGPRGSTPAALCPTFDRQRRGRRCFAGTRRGRFRPG